MGTWEGNHQPIPGKKRTNHCSVRYRSFNEAKGERERKGLCRSKCWASQRVGQPNQVVQRKRGNVHFPFVNNKIKTEKTLLRPRKLDREKIES